MKAAAPNFEPICYYGVDHIPHYRPSAAASRIHCVMATFDLTLLECRIYHQTMTKNRSHLSLYLRLGGLPSRPVEIEKFNAHGGNLICAHGTLILTNYEPFKLVEGRIFYALQVRTWTIIL